MKNFKFPDGVYYISVLLFCTFFITLFFVGKQTNVKWMNELGDSFGVLNTLFSGLAFAAIYLTLRFQQKEIENEKQRNRHVRFESTFFKYIDLRNALYTELKDSFATFELNVIDANLKPGETFEETRKRYQDHIEEPVVVKNYVNYLAMFDIMVQAINRKKEYESRKKYYALLAAQLHINEKRFFLYHFTLSKKKPPKWNELKVFLFAGITLDAIHPSFRNLKFDGLN